MLEWVEQYWIGVGFTVLSGAFGCGFKFLKKKISEQDSIKLGVQALLRDRIIQSYNHYMDKGYCPIYARENIDALSKEYYNLGGNGVVKSLLEKINSLPTEEPEEGVK